MVSKQPAARWLYQNVQPPRTYWDNHLRYKPAFNKTTIIYCICSHNSTMEHNTLYFRISITHCTARHEPPRQCWSNKQKLGAASWELSTEALYAIMNPFLDHGDESNVPAIQFTLWTKPTNRCSVISEVFCNTNHNQQYVYVCIRPVFEGGGFALFILSSASRELLRRVTMSSLQSTSTEF